MIRNLSALALLAMASAAAAQTAPAAPPTLYLVMYQQGPGWIAGKPMHQQRLREHVSYVQGLIAGGQAVAGGPYGAGDGGMAILRVASEAEAKAILAADPAVLNGTFTASVRAWTPVLDSRQPLTR